MPLDRTAPVSHTTPSHQRPIRLLGAAALAAAVVGCGDDPTYYSGADAAGDEAGGDASTGDVVTVDLGGGGGDVVAVDLGGGGGDTVAVDLGGADAAAPTVFGGVVVFETRAPAVEQLDTGGLGAGFGRTPTEIPVPDEVIGGCGVSATGGGADLFEAAPSLDAGTITVQIGGASHTLTRSAGDAGDVYARSGDAAGNEIFEAGASVRATSAGGGDVPAFDVSVAAPAEPVISEPAWGFGDQHDRTTPLTVRWSGTGTADVVVNVLPVTLFPTPGIGEGNALTCVVPDTGSFTIPAAALGRMPSEGGALGNTVALTIVRTSVNTEVAAGASVSVSAIASHTIVGALR